MHVERCREQGEGRAHPVLTGLSALSARVQVQEADLAMGAALQWEWHLPAVTGAVEGGKAPSDLFSIDASGFSSARHRPGESEDLQSHSCLEIRQGL